MRALAIIAAGFLAGCGAGQLEHEPAMVFGDLAIGQSRGVALQVTNRSEDPVALTFEVTPGDFSLDEATRTLGAHQTSTLLVRFSPQDLGVREGALVLRSARRVSQVTLSGRGTGPRLAVPEQLNLGLVALVGGAPADAVTSKLVLRNTGTLGSTLTLALPRVEGAELCVGTFFRSVCQPWLPPPSLDAGALVEVPISLLTSTPGPRRWTVVFPSDDVLHPETSVEVLAFVESYEPCVFSAPIEVVLVNQPVELRLTHTGPGTCLVRDFTLTSTPPGVFVFADAVHAPVRLESGASISKWISLRVPTPLQASGVVHVLAAGTAPLDVLVRLERPPLRCLETYPEVLDFGVVKVGCFSPNRNLQLYDVCGAPLTVTSVEVVAGSPAFSLVQGLPPGTVLSPGFIPATLALRYRPPGVGADTGALRVSTLENGDYLVALQARGDPAPQQVDTFRQDALPIADVLVMVDASPSFVPRRAAARANLSSLLTNLGSRCVDARWSFAAADGAPDAGVELLANDAGARWTSTLDTAFVERALSAFDTLPIGSELEACVGPAAALMADAGVRDGGGFSGLCITDALEQSPNPTGSLQALRGLNAPGFFSWSTITATESSSCLVEAVDDGVHLALTNGGHADVCSSTWWQSFLPLGLNARDCGRMTFFLTSQPAGALDVRLDGRPVPGADWTYDAGNNAVVFVPGREPQPGQTLQIGYVASCFLP